MMGRSESPHCLAASGETAQTSLKPAGRLLSESVGALFIPVSDCGALHRPRRLRGVELPVALFYAASPLVPGNDDADMVRASPLACSGDFLLRLAGCQGKNLLAKGRRDALATSWYRGRCGPTPSLPRWSSRLCCRGRGRG